MTAVVESTHALSRLATARPRPWWRRAGPRELALLTAVYALYDASRYLVEGRRSAALAHAWSVLHLEQALHLAGEGWFNRLVSAHAVLAISSDYVYATLHYLVTPAVLVWLWRRHRDVYLPARRTLLLATVLALVGFSLVPVAPPRMLPGYIDTMAQFAHAGWWGTDASAPRGVGSLTNEFAAMPSLHVGWALWCGWQLLHHARRRWVRVAGAAYPLMVTAVVIATGNHYLLDAAAGALLIGAAGVAAARLATWAPAVRPAGRHPAPVPLP